MSQTQTATARIATRRAERLGKQLVSHWGRHADEVTHGEKTATMVFTATERWPASTVRVAMTDSTLTVSVTADGGRALQENCDSLADHLHRFAGAREQLDIGWVRE